MPSDLPFCSDMVWLAFPDIYRSAKALDLIVQTALALLVGLVRGSDPGTPVLKTLALLFDTAESAARI